MMNMLWVELTLSSVLLNIESTIWDVVPSGLGLISEHDIGTIGALKPSPESVLKSPGVEVIWTLMEPMVLWALVTLSKSVNVRGWELTLESWDNVVEAKSVG